jgi:hypothetical protein
MAWHCDIGLVVRLDPEREREKKKVAAAMNRRYVTGNQNWTAVKASIGNREK